MSQESSSRRRSLPTTNLPAPLLGCKRFSRKWHNPDYATTHFGPFRAEDGRGKPTAVTDPTTTGLAPDELARRLRRYSRRPEDLARRCGLPAEVVRQLIDGNIINPTPEIRARLLHGLTADT